MSIARFLPRCPPCSASFTEKYRAVGPQKTDLLAVVAYRSKTSKKSRAVPLVRAARNGARWTAHDFSQDPKKEAREKSRSLWREATLNLSSPVAFENRHRPIQKNDHFAKSVCFTTNRSLQKKSKSLSHPSFLACLLCG